MLIREDLDVELDEFVERFEAAHAGHPGVDVAQFMPDRAHPRYATIGCELLRVHMELSATSGKIVTAEEYRERFPDICRDEQLFAALQAEQARVAVCSHAIRLDKSAASLGSTTVPADAIVQMPQVGQSVCGFRLLTELGRGAFSHVFLAQEEALSQRRVVLKVSSKLQGEANLLSRLQHKNIVPVYSLHRHGQFHLICMPFLGTMTLADMLNPEPRSGSSALSGKELISTLAAHASSTWRNDNQATLESHEKVTPAEPIARGLSSQLAAEVARMSTTELALWIISELADGLTHAHQRGVLHRDIKPANVLLSDDGLPMLLDFNLAASTGPDDQGHKIVGGTLRYMSPEQVRAVQNQRSTLDSRADVFSLGVVLYELLYLRAPYPDRTGSWSDVLAQMSDDRERLPAMAIRWRDGLTPAVVSILTRALAFDPKERYQSAAELRDDLRAHLQARVLRTARDRSARERIHKWNVRHPRLSALTISAVLMVLLLCGTLTWAQQRQLALNRLQAVHWLNQLEHAQSEARNLLASENAPTRAIEAWLERSAQVLGDDQAHHLSRLPPGDSAKASVSLGRLHFYRARGAIGLMQRHTATPHAVWLDLADAELQKSQSFASAQLTAAWQKWLQQFRQSSQKSASGDSSDRHPTDMQVSSNTQPSMPAAPRMDPSILRHELDDALATAHAEASNAWHWLSIGQIQMALGETHKASASFTLSHTLASREPLPTFFLGLVEMQRKNFAAAEDWFTFTLAEDPQCWEAWLNRAASRVELSRLREAVEDVQAMQGQADRYPRAWFIRELAETRMGQSAAARRSREHGLQLVPTDALGWNARGQARLRQRPADPEGALADFEMAIQLDPQLRNAYENAAHVLAERLKQPQAAMARLSEVLLVAPDYALAWSSRAVLRARQGDMQAAVADVTAALALERTALVCYQCASALALVEANAQDAPHAEATSSTVQSLPENLTSLQLLKETLRQEPSLSRLMRQDEDLRALLKDPEFQALITAAARLQ